MTFDPLIDPDEVRDYTWEWAARLADEETITSHTITAAGGTVDSHTATSTTVTAWISHPTRPCSITCHVTTTGGRQYDDTIQLTVRQL